MSEQKERNAFSSFFLTYKEPSEETRAVLDRFEMQALVFPGVESAENIATKIRGGRRGITPVYVGGSLRSGKPYRYCEVLEALVKEQGIPILMVPCQCTEMLPFTLASQWGCPWLLPHRLTMSRGDCPESEIFALEVRDGLLNPTAPALPARIDKLAALGALRWLEYALKRKICDYREEADVVEDARLYVNETLAHLGFCVTRTAH